MADLHTTSSRVRTTARHALAGSRPSDAELDAGPVLDRRTPLPSGRAVIGALLVTVAAVGVFAAYRSASEGPRAPIVVAATDLPAGHRLEPGDVRVERAELPPTLAAQSFESSSTLDGGVTLTPLRSGELVQRSAVLSPGQPAPPARQFSFAVDRERAVNGGLQRGEHVDVLATFGTGESAYTSVVARDVSIIDIEGGTKSSGIGSSGKLTVTVELPNADDVLRLAHATQVAPITLVRTTRAGSSDPGTIDSYPARSPNTARPNTQSGAGAAASSGASAEGMKNGVGEPTVTSPTGATGATGASGSKPG